MAETSIYAGTFCGTAPTSGLWISTSPKTSHAEQASQRTTTMGKDGNRAVHRHRTTSHQGRSEQHSRTKFCDSTKPQGHLRV